jgi:hypothetical protein
VNLQFSEDFGGYDRLMVQLPAKYPLIIANLPPIVVVEQEKRGSGRCAEKAVVKLEEIRFVRRTLEINGRVDQIFKKLRFSLVYTTSIVFT